MTLGIFINFSSACFTSKNINDKKFEYNVVKNKQTKEL
jgi:hypothetical protein